MRIPIPEHVKSDVIDAWLMGKSRDNISSEFNISTGSVSNIIEQWENMIGVYDAHNLRKLGLALKKVGITPSECVDGLRITNIINQLNIDKDHLFDFVNKLYDESKKERLEPSGITRIVNALKAFPEINSLNDIPQYINKKWQEKRKLDEDINYKKHEIEKLDQEIDRKRKDIQDLKDDLESVRKENQEEKKDFLLFREAKDELKKNDIDIQVLEPLIHVIKIFQEKRFRPLTILSEFSDIKAYRDLIENREREIEKRDLHNQELKTISDIWERKLASNETIIQYITYIETLGFKASDIKNLERTLSNISKKFGLKKEEIKIRFFRYMENLDTLLTFEQDIFNKKYELSILNKDISSGRNIKDSQPVIFSILQHLVNSGLNEPDILMAFKIFKTDLCNKMPYGNRTYLECLSKDVDKYKTVQEALKSCIKKFVLVKSNFEVFLFSASLSFYFYSLILNVQMQVQKELRILLIHNFTYLPFLCIVKRNKNLNSSEFKIEQNYSKNSNNKKMKKKKEKGKKYNKKLLDKTKRNDKKKNKLSSSSLRSRYKRIL